MTALVVIAKEPVPGRVKTRLQPELTLEQAAMAAAGLISDTLATARTVRASRHILFWDGEEAPPAAGGFELIRQPGGELDERLAYIFDRVGEPMVLIGMDTPQFTAAQLAPVFPEWPRAVDAVFGPAEDGGFWAIGMREPRGALIEGVPMSRPDTGARQLARLHDARLLVTVLPALLDVDDFRAATRVAELAPNGAFAATMHRFRAGVAA